MPKAKKFPGDDEPEWPDDMPAPDDDEDDDDDARNRATAVAVDGVPDVIATERAHSRPRRTRVRAGERPVSPGRAKRRARKKRDSGKFRGLGEEPVTP